MLRWKKIALSIIILVFVSAYIAGASFAIKLIFKPITISVLEFGGYNVVEANTEIDLDDENKNTLYNNINRTLISSEENELNSLKLIALYKIYNKEDTSAINESETITLEISQSIAKDATIKIIKINSDKVIEFIDFDVEKRIKDNANGNDEEYFVLLFDIEEQGHYGLVSERGEASLASTIVWLSIIVNIILFLILFIFVKAKNNSL